jgi:hypothetical protein
MYMPAAEGREESSGPIGSLLTQFCIRSFFQQTLSADTCHRGSAHTSLVFLPTVFVYTAIHSLNISVISPFSVGRPIHVGVCLASPAGINFATHTHMSLATHTRTSLAHRNPSRVGLASQTRTCISPLRWSSLFVVVCMYM